MDDCIFINYRRGEDQAAAGRLYDQLESAFSRARIFIDVDSIVPGRDFTEELAKRVAECDIFLALIGRHWADVVDVEGGRRLDNPNDWVRVEIESAQRLGKHIIPVLVDGAEMPRPEKLPESLQPLVRRHAARLSHERFRADAQGLIAVITRVREAAEQEKARREAEQLRREAEQAETTRREVEQLQLEAGRAEAARRDAERTGAETERRAKAQHEQAQRAATTAALERGSSERAQPSPIAAPSASRSVAKAIVVGLAALALLGGVLGYAFLRSASPPQPAADSLTARVAEAKTPPADAAAPPQPAKEASATPAPPEAKPSVVKGAVVADAPLTPIASPDVKAKIETPTPIAAPTPVKDSSAAPVAPEAKPSGVSSAVAAVIAEPPATPPAPATPDVKAKIEAPPPIIAPTPAKDLSATPAPTEAEPSAIATPAQDLSPAPTPPEATPSVVATIADAPATPTSIPGVKATIVEPLAPATPTLQPSPTASSDDGKPGAANVEAELTPPAAPAAVTATPASTPNVKATVVEPLPAAAPSLQPSPSAPTDEAKPRAAVLKAELTSPAAPLPASPSPVAAPAPAQSDIAALTPLIIAQLRRLGCYGGATANWGAVDLRVGVDKYAQLAKLAVIPSEPDAALLADLKSRPDNFCPPQCGPREVASGGRCVPKTCLSLQILTAGGVCVAVTRPVAKRSPTAPRPAATGHCFTFNGSSYCE